MQRRGRDRQVSAAAQARLRSIERSRHHSTSRSRSPSPLSSAESLSPRYPQSREPTPPPTLSDQVHIAYADDDIHLAKVLLLRLQGIEVTSDNDPRIAAVKDEDFDACFIPFGRLDDGLGSSNYSINSISKSPPAPVPPEDDARLKAKEALWESEARRFTEERNRCAALRRRQGDSQRVATLEAERLRLIRQKEAAAAVVDLRRKRMTPTARTLNFALVPPVPPPRPQKFTYDFPFTPRTITPRARVPPSPSSSSSASSSTQPIPARRRDEPQPQLETRTPTRVTFQQVLASMRGALFPDPIPLLSRGSGSADRGKARRERALLDALLVAGVSLDDLDFDPRRKGKGKGRAVPPPRCAGCYTAPSLSQSVPAPASPAASTLSRAGSWLSFGSSSLSSTSTSTSSSRSSTSSSTSNTVSTAPSSWTSASTLLSSSRSTSNSDSPPQPKSPSLRLMAANWLPGARRTASPEPEPEVQQRRAHTGACRLRYAVRSKRTAVEVHPLAIVPAPTATSHSSARRRPPHMQRTSSSSTQGEEEEEGVAAPHTGLPFTLALTRLATLARNLQTAYVRAVVVGYGVGGHGEEYSSSAYDAREYDEWGGRGEGREVSVYGAETRKDREVKQQQPLRRVPLASTLRVRTVGARAGRGEVRAFLSASAPASALSSVANASGDADTNATGDANAEDEDRDLAPTTPLSTLPPRFNSNSPSARRPALDAYTHPPTRTALPARLPYALVFSQPLPLPRSPWAAAAAAAERASVSATTPPSSTADMREGGEYEEYGYGHGYGEDGGDDDDLHGQRVRVRGRVRARAVPNSAFLRVKALHQLALVHFNSGDNTEAASGPASAAAYPPTPRRPRECVVGLGVDRAGRLGSGLRFVFARGVPVGG